MPASSSRPARREEILTAPAHPYTAKLIDCVPVLGQPERRLDAIGGRPPVVNGLPVGCAFAERCPRVEDDCRAAPIALTEFGAGPRGALHPSAGRGRPSNG